MKKFLVLLLLVAMVAPIFADDAKVLPARIGRLYIVPAYSMWSQGFDADGEKQDNSYGDASAFNVAAALEYGITDIISFGLKYVPGYVISTNFADSDTLDGTGTSGADVGFKIQLMGPNAPMQSDTMRFAVVPGVNIPFAKYDAEAEATAMNAGDSFSAGGVSNSSLGFGLQASFDYVVSDSLYINLFSEFRGYMPADFVQAGITPYATYAASAAAAYAGYSAVIAEPGEVKYGYDLTVELDPGYDTSLGGGMNLSAGLALTYDYNPGQSFVDDYSTGLASAYDALSTGIEEAITDALAEDSYSFTVTPNVGLFLTGLPIPMEFNLDASIPVMGKNTSASTTVLLTWKTYFKT